MYAVDGCNECATLGGMPMHPITLQEPFRAVFYAPFYAALARGDYAAEGVEVHAPHRHRAGQCQGCGAGRRGRPRLGRADAHPAGA